MMKKKKKKDWGWKNRGTEEWVREKEGKTEWRVKKKEWRKGIKNKQERIKIWKKE